MLSAGEYAMRLWLPDWLTGWLALFPRGQSHNAQTHGHANTNAVTYTFNLLSLPLISVYTSAPQGVVINEHLREMLQ